MIARVPSYPRGSRAWWLWHEDVVFGLVTEHRLTYAKRSPVPGAAGRMLRRRA
jgi:hypothetical protein